MDLAVHIIMPDKSVTRQPITMQTSPKVNKPRRGHRPCAHPPSQDLIAAIVQEQGLDSTNYFGLKTKVESPASAPGRSSLSRSGTRSALPFILPFSSTTAHRLTVRSFLGTTDLQTIDVTTSNSGLWTFLTDNVSLGEQRILPDATLHFAVKYMYVDAKREFADCPKTCGLVMSEVRARLKNADFTPVPETIVQLAGYLQHLRAGDYSSTRRLLSCGNY